MMRREKNRNQFLLMMFMFFAPLYGIAQVSNIAGYVNSAGNAPLPRVSVVVKGTNRGTTTNNDGYFQLENIALNSVLEISSAGYLTKEVVASSSPMQIILENDTKALEQVVVIGYGTRRREDLVGSVSQVTASQIEDRPVVQLSNALAGQMTGINAVQLSGKPGANSSNISIRGVGSFGASSAALVLVDGIPGSLDNVDPNDVETISVLKDASTAAIYGSRAANGVILVTTKSGSKQKTQILYNGYVGFQKPTKFPQFADSWDYAAMYNEAAGTTTYTADDIEKFKDGSDPDGHPNTKFLDSILSKNGLQTSHNVTVSGGAERIKYNVSLGYLFQDGLVVKNNYNRANLRVNLTADLTKKISLTARLFGMRNEDKEPNAPATFGNEATGVLYVIGQSVRYPAVNAGRLSNGYFGTGVVQKGTPISFLESESFMKNRFNTLNTNLRLDYKIINDLKLSFISAYNFNNGRRTDFLATQRINASIFLEPNELTLTNNNTDYYTLQGLADYSKKIGDHTIGALLGYSFEKNRFENTSVYRNRLPGNELIQINVGSPDGQQATGGASEWAMESYFGRVNYSFKSKYLVEGVLRRDGSSRFPVTRKYAYFPAAAIGYRLGEEPFIKENLPWIDELKFKASYGILGNQNIANFQYLKVYNTGVNFSYPFSSTISPGVAFTTITDSTLHWESTRTTDFGVELAVLKNFITFSATYFNRYTYEILASPGGSVSNVLGFSLSKQNSGKLSNRGWEFALGHNNHIGAFGYFLNANLTILKNEVLDLGVGNVNQPNGLVGNGNTLFIGYPMQIYYGYKADGIFNTTEEIAAYPTQTAINPGVKPGDIRYADISGPDGKPDGKVDATYDRMVLGSNIPKYTYGTTIGANYKGFDFSILLQGVSGNRVFMNNYAGLAFFNFGSIQKWQMDERWTPQNLNANAGYPRLELVTNSGTPNTLMSSFWMLNGSYLRGKNVQVGYSLPKNITERMHINGLRFFASGDNLFTISKYRPGWDPENSVDGNANDDSNTLVLSNNYYPIIKNFTFGLNVKF